MSKLINIYAGLSSYMYIRYDGAIYNSISVFHRKHSYNKRGIAMMAIRFQMGYSVPLLNQVNIYTNMNALPPMMTKLKSYEKWSSYFNIFFYAKSAGN